MTDISCLIAAGVLCPEIANVANQLIPGLVKSVILVFVSLCKMTTPISKTSDPQGDEMAEQVIGHICKLSTLPVPAQKEFGGVPLPAVCQCVESTTVELTCSWIESNQVEIEQLLKLVLMLSLFNELVSNLKLGRMVPSYSVAFL